MINMMYLVLTAMLALNVSAEVLRAFNLVNNGLERTTETYAEKNAMIYQQFQAQLQDDPKRVGPLWEDAQTVQTEADEMYAYLESLKQSLIEEGGGRDPEMENRIENEKDIDIATRRLVEGEEGKELKAKILETRQELLAQVPEDAEVNIPLNAVEPEKEPGDVEKVTWQSQLFREVPLTAAVTMLSKLQNDVRNSEGEVINALFKQIKGNVMNFDAVRPIVQPTSNLVMLNEDIKATIAMGAYSTTQEFKVTINGKEYESEAGRVEYEAQAAKEGVHEISGTITYIGPDGEEKVVDFTEPVQVFQGSATISADAMNVLYIGLENPISISVPGFPPDKIRASLSNGNLKGANGKYVALPKDPGRSRDRSAREAVITASVELPSGQTKVMGSKEYRIRPVPEPTAYVGPFNEGAVSANALASQPGVTARLGEGFAFEGLNFSVRGYRFLYQPKRGNVQTMSVNGYAFTPQIQSILRNASPGDMVIFTDIVTEAPGVGKKRPSGMVFTIK